MQIELKNINYRISGDNEYPPFQADLYVNHQPAARVNNDGYGAATIYTPVGTHGQMLTTAAETYCQGLGVISYPENAFYDHSGFNLAPTLLTEIDHLFDKHLNEKEFVGYELHRQREMNRSLIWGKDRTFYQVYNFSLPLARLIPNPNGAAIIRDALQRIMPRLKPGEKIQNTNVPEEILQSAGLRPEQYTKPIPPLRPLAKQQASKKSGRRL